MSIATRLRIPSKVKIRVSETVGRVLPGLAARRVRRPHFIVSSGRSGTTMLNALFDLHPDVANYPSEANELWHPQLYPWATSTVSAPPYWLDPHAFTKASLALRTPADDALLCGTFGAYQAMTRSPVLMVKTVMVTFMIDHVLALFPDARFIHQYRDGRAVAASWLIKDRHKLDAPRARAAGLAFTDDDLLDRYLAYWSASMRAVEAADAAHGLTASGRLLQLGYEDLCRDPHGQLAAMANFMGVSPQPFLQADLREIRSSNDKSRQQLSDATLRRLNQAAGAVLRTKGYTDDIL